MKKVDGIQHYSALIGESTELDSGELFPWAWALGM